VETKTVIIKNPNSFKSSGALSEKTLFTQALILKKANFYFLFVVLFSLFYVGCQESTIIPEDAIEPQSESEILAMSASKDYLDTLSFGQNFDYYITDTSSAQDTFQFSGIDSSGNNFQVKIINVPNTDSFYYFVSGTGPLPGDTYEVNAIAVINSMDDSLSIQSISISQNGSSFQAAAGPYWECLNETYANIMNYIDSHAVPNVICRFTAGGCAAGALAYSLVACAF